MTRRVAFVYEDAVSQHLLRDDHPMQPVRLRHTFELLQAYGITMVPRFIVSSLDEAVAPLLQRLQIETQTYIQLIAHLLEGAKRLGYRLGAERVKAQPTALVKDAAFAGA